MVTKVEPNPANLEKAALLIIDVQQGLFEKNTPIFQAERLIQNIHSLVEKAHSAKAPVVYIQHNDDKYLVKGSNSWQLHPELRPEPQDWQVYKEHGNAFEKTNLGELLTSRQIGKVIIAGLVTHGCVKNTSLGALEEGYQVILVGDTHSSYSKDAAALISKWNHDLAEKRVVVKKAGEVSF